ncbi:MAG: hypothetical protein E7652_00465 [Ruminococcaceae bacterium]|nr:hypothetical protein [Oscillospiraceae bacterium]
MSELEQKLSEYEEKKPVGNDAELTEAIEEILSKEESLPYEYRNYELIDEAVEALLILNGEDITTLDKEAEKNARNIINNKKSKSITLKRVLLIAAVLVMMSALTVSTLSVLNTSDKNTDIPIDPIDITKKEPSPDTDAPSTDSNTLNNETDSIITEENIITEPYITEPITDVPVTSNDDPKPIGGTGICEVHNFGYHCYPKEIKDYIGEEHFRKWSNEAHSTTNEEGCWPNGNILLCIEYFDVPDEIIIEAYQNDYYNRDWDIKALLERDHEAFERYARNSITTNSSAKLSSEQSLKFRLFDFMKTKTDKKTVDYYNTITNNGSYFPCSEITLYDMISNTSLTKDDFINALGDATSNNREDFVTPYFEYNLDLLFGDTETLTKMIDNLEIPYYESRVKMADALLHIAE